MPKDSFEYYIYSLARLDSKSDAPSRPINNKAYLSSKIYQFNSNFHEHYSTEVETLIHFVWIGNISSTSCKFIQLWSYRNPDYSLVLWRLQLGLLASKVKLYLNIFTKKIQFPSLSSAQDAFYKHYDSLKLYSINVNLTLLSFLELHNKTLNHETKKEYIALIKREKQLSKQFDIRYIVQETGIFENKGFKLSSYFTREIILRQNAGGNLRAVIESLAPETIEALGLLLHIPEIGFAFPDQTMYTYHHLESTWM